MSDWISVINKFPETSGRYLVVIEYEGESLNGHMISEPQTYMTFFDAVLQDGGIFGTGQHGEIWEEVTHWMPLPEPPTGEQEDN